MTEQTPPAERRPLAKRPVFWLALVAVLLLIVAAIFAGMAIGGGLGSSADAAASESPRPTPSATSTAPTEPAPEPTATTPPPTAGGVTIPSDCTGIYTRDWATELAPLVLNPAWTNAADSGVRWASDDVGLQTMLEGTTRLTCIWGHPAGGGDVGITTNVATLTEVQQSDTITHLESLGYDCFDELEGVRCIDEHDEEAGAWGESHFLREGVWIATGWVNSGPIGYTHDIVTTIFG